MIEQIKQALEKATPDWHYNENEIVSKQNLRMGIGGFLKDEDNRLAANAPEWLRYLIGEVERLKFDCDVFKSATGAANDGFIKAIDERDQLKGQVEELQKALGIVRDTLNHKKNGDRTSWALWDVANKALERSKTK